MYVLEKQIIFKRIKAIKKDERFDIVKVKNEMDGTEKYQDAKFKNVLPTEVYFDIEKKKDDILP